MAERLQKYRTRKSEVKKIVEAMASEAKDGLEELLWSSLTAFEGYPFRTAKGLRFHYSIKDNEIFFSRKSFAVRSCSVGQWWGTDPVELKRKLIL